VPAAHSPHPKKLSRNRSFLPATGNYYAVSTYDHGIRPIEVSPLADPRLVSTVLAATLDLEIGSDNALPGLVVAAKPGDSSTPK
jgi:hypothetical protein